MIIIKKGQSNTFITTLSERLVNYGLSVSSGQTFYFTVVNDLTQQTTALTLVDESSFFTRANQFTFNESSYNFTTGAYTYTAYADSGYTQPLETGRMIVMGSMSGNSLYW